MLTVYTSTFCRPDYVQLLADSLVATCQQDYRFVVFVQPGGLRRNWGNVHAVVEGTTAGYGAWRDIVPAMGSGESLILHDDCVPVLPFTAEMFAADHMVRPGGTTLQFHRGGNGPPRAAVDVFRVRPGQECPAGWGAFCEQAGTCQVESMCGGTFLHIDKGTIFSPAAAVNAGKRALVEQIAAALGFSAPDELTADELAQHPGRMSGPTYGLGDMVAAGLSAVGITKERAQRVASAVGVKDCGCAKRQEALNKLGRRLGIG